jgi:hypothetical protein
MEIKRFIYMWIPVYYFLDSNLLSWSEGTTIIILWTYLQICFPIYRPIKHRSKVEFEGTNYKRSFEQGTKKSLFFGWYIKDKI